MTGLLLGAALVMITGYTDPGLTADGIIARPGVAACPQELAFGTALDIDGIGVVVCHDRTPGNPNLIDVWVPTVADAYAITGVHRVQVLPDEEPVCACLNQNE